MKLTTLLTIVKHFTCLITNRYGCLASTEYAKASREYLKNKNYEIEKTLFSFNKGRGYYYKKNYNKLQ